MTARPDSTLGYTIQPKMRPDPAPQARSDAQRPGNFGLRQLCGRLPRLRARAGVGAYGNVLLCRDDAGCLVLHPAQGGRIVKVKHGSRLGSLQLAADQSCLVSRSGSALVPELAARLGL